MMQFLEGRREGVIPAIVEGPLVVAYHDGSDVLHVDGLVTSSPGSSRFLVGLRVAEDASRMQLVLDGHHLRNHGPDVLDLGELAQGAHHIAPPVVHDAAGRQIEAIASNVRLAALRDAYKIVEAKE